MCMGGFTVPRQEGDASLGKHLRTLVQNSRKLRGGCKNNFFKKNNVCHVKLEVCSKGKLIQKSYLRRRAGAAATTRAARRATTSPGCVSLRAPSFSLPPGGNSGFNPSAYIFTDLLLSLRASLPSHGGC